ncbi:Uncharacterised protein [Escherichia coli]|uniref:hypothetical protein n=1 Tax=Escherichia coli TaxID=562 RepID=UPI001A5E9812|nr:hypothetical protein [Escherichia coli]MDI1143977.1 hypothetical protein [Escherichia coli]VVZ30385.1 Uncharacterised protein [Escherichia coli]VVZ35205.1 Uncharacterised protein [Escherichia coli]VWN21051.1 Uncharacterised protein [Escherichia coli]HBC8436975.1 hypothetical protein [Escherichia coli]
MTYFLVQTDADDELISKTEIDINDYRTVLDAIHYYDVRHKGNREEIKNWIELGEYKVESLSISGDESEEDGFITETMYLTIENDF